MSPGKMPAGKVLPGNKTPRKIAPEKLPPGKLPPRKITPPENCPSPVPLKKYFVKLLHVMKYLSVVNFINFNFRQS